MCGVAKQIPPERDQQLARHYHDADATRTPMLSKVVWAFPVLLGAGTFLVVIPTSSELHRKRGMTRTVRQCRRQKTE